MLPNQLPLHHRYYKESQKAQMPSLADVAADAPASRHNCTSHCLLHSRPYSSLCLPPHWILLQIHSLAPPSHECISSLLPVVSTVFTGSTANEPEVPVDCINEPMKHEE